MFLGRWPLEGFSLVRDVLRTTRHARCQIRKPLEAVDKSGSAMLRIRHCGRLNRAEGDASTTENIFFLRKTIRRAAGEGYWTRFEGRCTDGQN
ncbi:hypothetical protein X753_30820 [Mesorhizobium sp. LNJC399B00]|nr:hypothetical protein X753_30820 [Mesorhizobium sp. LNJC399B00]